MRNRNFPVVRASRIVSTALNYSSHSCGHYSPVYYFPMRVSSSSSAPPSRRGSQLRLADTFAPKQNELAAIRGKPAGSRSSGIENWALAEEDSE
jgi:hypothetical protein